VRVRKLHAWDLGPAEAIRLQEALSTEVVLEGSVPDLRWAAGCDVAYAPKGDLLFGGAVLWDLRERIAAERVVARGSILFPYVPGLLGFREIPILLDALSQLKGKPQVVLVDGAGVAHPRRFGLATHLGLHLDVPTVGCAKSRLVGQHGPLGWELGAHAWLSHGGRVLGFLLRTRRGVRPLYVSPGHRISPEGALEVMLQCLGRFRIPEPLRQAHILVEREKRPASPNPPPNSGSYAQLARFAGLPDHQEGVKCKAPRSERKQRSR
jgi:deoxyribonuclease V